MHGEGSGGGGGGFSGGHGGFSGHIGHGSFGGHPGGHSAGHQPDDGLFGLVSPTGSRPRQPIIGHNITWPSRTRLVILLITFSLAFAVIAAGVILTALHH